MRGVTLCIITYLFWYLAYIADGRRARYDRFKVYDYKPRTRHNLRQIGQIQDLYQDDVNFWKMAPSLNKTGTFMVSPRLHHRLVNYMRTSNFVLTKRYDNVQRLVNMQTRQNRLLRISNFLRTSYVREPHTYYMRYNEMLNWMRSVARSCIYPLRCKVISIGRSHQLRQIYLFKIYNSVGRQKFWIDAGIHPREWIAPSTALYIIKKLTEYGSEAKAMLDKFEFHILPLMNPDGYEYTHTHSRFWRKNLAQTDYYCRGVDLNRNFGYQWGGSGSSSNPCADNYRGRTPFSEAETRVVNGYLRRNSMNMLVFLTLHSYGQYILIPFGHRKQFYPLNKTQLMNIGHAMAQKMSIFSGRYYDVGSAADLLYEASGGSTDYVSAMLNVPYTYTIELPDTGRYAFFLPPQNIIHVGNETWVAIKEISTLA